MGRQRKPHGKLPVRGHTNPTIDTHTPMLRFVDVASIHDIPEGRGRAFPVAGRMVAIFRLSDSLRAIDDFCPHMGASLGDGWVEDGCVSCPWHAWRFQLSDGAWMDNPKIKTQVFPVRLVGDRVEVEIDWTGEDA
jgi:nitrite reductase/ring-hydroxylating ferredoxin subunit